MADVALRTAQRLDKLLRAHGRTLLRDEYSDPEPPALQLEHPALAACYDAASRGLTVSGDREGQPSLRLVQGEGTPPAASRQDTPAAEVFGVNLDAPLGVDLYRYFHVKGEQIEIVSQDEYSAQTENVTVYVDQYGRTVTKQFVALPPEEALTVVEYSNAVADKDAPTHEDLVSAGRSNEVSP